MDFSKMSLLDYGEEMVAYGIHKGADQVQITIGDGNEFSVDVRNGQIEKLVESGSRGLSVKIIIDHKVATASSSDLSKPTLHYLIDNCIERASLSNQDTYSEIPDLKKIHVKNEELQIFDPKIFELPPTEKIAFAKKVEGLCLRNERIKISHGSNFSTHGGTYYLLNSNGFSGSYRQSSCSCSVYLQSGDNDNLIEEGWYDFSRNLDTLMKPEEIAEKATHRVIRLIGARKVATQNVPVIFEAPTTSGLLGFLYGCIDGHRVYLHQTFLSEKLGETIGSSNITVVDDGLLVGAPGTKPFDSEGVPTQKTVVIEDGILKNFLLDHYSARKLNMQSTGNASGPNNFYLQAGDCTLEEMIRSVDKGLMITGTLGQGVNPITGDISRGAFGMWIEKGVPIYPVAEITFSGNLGAILKSIELVGNDLNFKRTINGPSIKVTEMTIGGI